MKTESAKHTPTVKLSVESGLVEIMERPENVRVIICDYDIDGVDEEDLSKDELGADCILHDTGEIAAAPETQAERDRLKDAIAETVRRFDENDATDALDAVNTILRQAEGGKQ